MTPPVVSVPAGKAGALRHLQEAHGQVEPSSPRFWSTDELAAAHRAGHRPDGICVVPHTHPEFEHGRAA